MRVTLGHANERPALKLLRQGREAAARTVTPQQAREGPRAEARRAVGDLVGNVFYGTLLRQLDQSSLKGKYLHGGRGEDVLRGQLNQQLALRMGESPNDVLSNAVFKMITSRPKYGPALAEANVAPPKGAA